MHLLDCQGERSEQYSGGTVSNRRRASMRKWEYPSFFASTLYRLYCFTAIADISIFALPIRPAT